jgi:hypothetical protein
MDATPCDQALQLAAVIAVISALVLLGTGHRAEPSSTHPVVGQGVVTSGPADHGANGSLR